MALTGAWKARATIPADYTGALRWGTGVNQVHAVRSGPPGEQGRIISPMSGVEETPPDQILGAIDWGYTWDDSASMYPGEDYRYLEEDHANWDEPANTGTRPDRDGRITEPGVEPQPEGFPSWGPYYPSSEDFPVSGPSGGIIILDSYSDQLEYERQRAIAVPAPGSTGAWLSKVRSWQEESQTSDPGQYERTTSMQQVHAIQSNIAAVSRATDDARSQIGSRTAGMKVKPWAKDFEQGGGPGTPRMFPFQQDIMYRPFFFRRSGVPPSEPHTWNTATYWNPVQRQVPQDPYQGVPEGTAEGADTEPDYGYTDYGHAGGYYSWLS